eukprot:650019-Prymnesium_polylepis.2
MHTGEGGLKSLLLSDCAIVGCVGLRQRAPIQKLRNWGGRAAARLNAEARVPGKGTRAQAWRKRTIGRGLCRARQQTDRWGSGRPHVALRTPGRELGGCRFRGRCGVCSSTCATPR